MNLPPCPRRYCATSYENVSDLGNNANMNRFAVLGLTSWVRVEC